MNGLEYFAPAALWRWALGGFWPVWAITLCLFVAAVVCRCLRCRNSSCWHCRIRFLASLLQTWPIYCWGVLASHGAIVNFYSLGTMHGVPMQALWAIALSQVLALTPILVLVVLGAGLTAQGQPKTRVPALGPICAVGAVTADWIFGLTALTPFP